MNEVRATVRLQFHRNFTLNDALPLVPYFEKLGISHIYASPLLTARSGSMHGYDVVDPTRINPELGGEEALVRLVAELRQHKMGLILDIVSNHMAVGGSDNPWWQDVLRWGLKSPYAQFFDIQWNSPDPLLKGQLLLPFLESGYGEVLLANGVALKFDKDDGTFYAQHYDHCFPLYPPSYGHILGKTDIESLTVLGNAFEELENEDDGWAKAASLHRRLSDLAQDANVLASITTALRFYDVSLGQQTKVAQGSETEADPQDNDNFQRLHQLLELQHYRLASWRTASDDINWRRFFDVNELAGLRVERTKVFEATHAKIFELVGKGLVDGLRIDHVDGLANPRAYCRKLRRRVDALSSQRPGDLANAHIPIYVEKILADGEQLSTNWTVDGTTGYEFMNQVSLLQHDPRGELHLFDVWSTTTGRLGTFKDEVREARRLVLSGGLGGDVEMVAQGLLLIARNDIATRDLTLGAIRRALIELVVNFPVYRTYVSGCGRSEQDKRFFNEALEGAKLTLAEADWPLLDYLDRWLGGDQLHSLPPDSARVLRKQILARFQQLTSPAAAKAVEDTACYRSAVLLSRNDVGFNPHMFSAPLAQFHQQTLERAAKFPNNLLTTATHDHKRGEDTRARLAVVSERSVWFMEKLQHWQSLAAPLRANLEEGIAPSAGDELILYQTLLACWPLELKVDDEQGLQTYLERLLRWQEKALREAKLRSTWSAPHAGYEKANQEFLTRLLTADDKAELRSEIATAAQCIAPAGAINGLTQTLLRMTTPGVPDLYQGTEFWDFSLVDPDNRQPVDFAGRLDAISASTPVNQLIEQWRDGRIKQWLITQTLRARRDHSELFREGDYQPLIVEGENADNVVAFSRRNGNDYMIVVAPRLAANLLAKSDIPVVPAAAWGDTKIVLPKALQNAQLESKFSTQRFEISQGYLPVSEVLADLPVNILFSIERP